MGGTGFRARGIAGNRAGDGGENVAGDGEERKEENVSREAVFTRSPD